MIYLNDSQEIVPDIYLNDYINLLPEERRLKALSFVNIEDRKRCVAAYLLLCEGLKKEYGIENPPYLGYSEYGKPFLRDYPEIYFNISHCDKGVVCIISSSPVGIDLESIRPFDLELAEYVCSREEFNELQKSKDPSLLFTVLWTKKESLCKFSGRGISDSSQIKSLLAPETEPFFETIINSQKGYVMTLCKDYRKENRCDVS